MLEEKTLLVMITGMALVTYLPRVIPLHISSKHWPNWLKKCIEYLPVALISAITVPDMLIEQQNIELINSEFLAFIPTALVAYFTKNLIVSVIVGLLSHTIIEILVLA